MEIEDNNEHIENARINEDDQDLNNRRISIFYRFNNSLKDSLSRDSESRLVDDFFKQFEVTNIFSLIGIS